jgi:glyoxylase-like metal-dependent hydrolase (beta-lactamase superfamily II)
MKATQIGEYTFMLTFLGFSNCYLLRESDGLTLIDTSLPGCAKSIVAAARTYGAQIRRILLTHAHADHAGSVDRLCQILGPVDVAISEREAPLLHKDLSLRADEPQRKPKGSFPGAKTRPTHTLTDGELYGSLRCIATPGHTPGQMGFFDERTGLLFAGDALQSIGRLSVVTDTPWFFPLPKMATWDKPLAERSARRLAELKPAAIATGHGSFVSNGVPAMLRALQHAELA